MKGVLPVLFTMGHECKIARQSANWFSNSHTGANFHGRVQFVCKFTYPVQDRYCSYMTVYPWVYIVCNVLVYVF